MNIYEIMLLPLFAVVMLILPVVYILKKKKSNSAAKTAFVVNTPWPWPARRPGGRR